ncbi:MAG: hypothetical protein ACREXV_18300, partial [Polaromonas sp.]
MAQGSCKSLLKREKFEEKKGDYAESSLLCRIAGHRSASERTMFAASALSQWQQFLLQGITT